MFILFLDLKDETEMRGLKTGMGMPREAFWVKICFG